MTRSKPAQARAAVCAGLLGLLVAACGGGGGGGGGDPVAAPPTSVAPPAPPTGGVSNVRWLGASPLRVERDVFDTGVQVSVTASLALDAPNLAYWFSISHDPEFANVGYTFRSADDGLDIRLDIRTPADLAPGTYTDTLSVRLCEDEACTRPVAGSPFRLPVRLDLGYRALPEDGVQPLETSASELLAHDVRAAAYSAALDAVVLASATPAPALRVHRLATGTVDVIPLLTAPTALALSPDGRRAALGHDAAVSLVALDADPASAVRRIAVPAPVNAVALTAGGRIVATAGAAHSWNQVYWIETADGSVVRVGPEFGQLYGVSALRLHPSGDRVYAADTGISPDDVHRMDLGAAPAVAAFRDSSYHGTYPFCGLVQPSISGARLYTACGVVLSSAADPAADMLYAGRLALSSPPSIFGGPFRAVSMSVAPDDARLALIEQDVSNCDARISQLSQCHTRVAEYDTTTLARTTLRAMPVFARGDDRLRQWARWVGHRADGSLLVLAELRTKNEPAPAWVLHRVR
jgi:hypothetical protein